MRILHTMVRVGDLGRSIRFYTELLGMRLLRQKDYPDGKFTLAYLGYGPESEGPALELTYNYGVASYGLGKGYGHIAIEVADAAAICDKVRAGGGKVTYEAAPMVFDQSIKIAFLEDPDGYAVELIENPSFS
jgi:lactoylglutathione lyase